jgi:hypothetical protein
LIVVLWTVFAGGRDQCGEDALESLIGIARQEPFRSTMFPAGVL